MISWEHKFIFFENQKTASTSLCATLFPIINVERERELCPLFLEEIGERHHNIHKRHLKDGRGLWRDGHWRPSRYRRQLKDFIVDHYGTADYAYNRFLKFGVIRNPWDRLVSAYYHQPLLRRRGAWEKKREKKLSKFKSFTEFCQGSGGEDFFINGHFRPQSTFYRGARKSIHFLSFENLKEEFESFCVDHLGIPLTLSAHLNKSPNRKKDYRKHYTPETRDIIGKRYKKDIEIFGFEF